MPDLKVVRLSHPAMGFVKGDRFATRRSRQVSFQKTSGASLKKRTVSHKNITIGELIHRMLYLLKKKHVFTDT